MADPVISGVYRSLLILQGTSGLAEDRFITTWCFRAVATSDHEAVADRCAELLVDFINTPAGSSSGIAPYIGGQASRTAGASKVTTYHLGEAPPRVPMERPFTLGTGVGGAGSGPLPAEVALVLSMTTTNPGPSGHGRVYIGPLDKITGDIGTWGDSRPTVTLRNALCLAAGRLVTDAQSGTPALEWCVLSQKNSATYQIGGGWVDDAWDTQRRRGLDATGRITWPIP